MSRRHLLKVKISVEKLLPLAEKEAKHHRGREEHYRAEYIKAEKDLKENGIVMQENANIYASGAITGYGYGGKSMTPVVNQEKVEKVNTAKDKVNEHQKLAIEYEKYVAYFKAVQTADPTRVLSLDADDVVFFKV